MALKKDLVAAAKEMNTKMELNPPIKLNSTVPVLEDLIKQAIKLIEPTDKLGKSTIAVISEYGYLNETTGKWVVGQPEVPSTQEVPKEEAKDEAKAETAEKPTAETTEKPTAETTEKPTADATSEKPEEAEKPATKAKPVKQGVTKFGHKIASFAGKIDMVLINAKNPVSKEDIIKRTKCKAYKVGAHIRHLKEKCKVGIVEKDGKFSLKA